MIGSRYGLKARKMQRLTAGLYSPESKSKHTIPGKHTVTPQAFFFLSRQEGVCNYGVSRTHLKPLCLIFRSFVPLPLGWGKALDQALRERS